MEGLLISAFKLDEDTVKKLEAKFSKEIGEKIEFRVEIDRSLIGGFIVSIRHHRYDYSIKEKLKDMKNYLTDI